MSKRKGNHLPKSVIILGIKYKIKYKDKPSEVDIYKRDSLWGQIDYWTRTIRIFDHKRPIEDLWQTIIHEVIHGISSQLNLCLDESKYHDDLDILSMAIVDTLIRNGWMKAKIK